MLALGGQTSRAAASTSFVSSLYDFSLNGQPTIVERRDGVDFFFNEFWTARQRQAHRLHEISYRACFKPQLPAFFIERLTAPGDRVYDPFMGRGTAPLQAALMGRIPVGNDINPLSATLTRPRLDPPRYEDIIERLRTIDWLAAEDLSDDLLAFFHPRTLTQISALRAYLLHRERERTLDKVDEWIRMVALNRLTGHSPGFFSVYTLPPNQAVSPAAQRKINALRDQAPPERDVAAIILKKTRALLSDGPCPSIGEPLLLASPAEATPEIASGSIDLVVTSPPFLDVVQYAADNWMRCWFVGLDPESIPIAMHRDLDEWTTLIGQVFRELVRVTRVGGCIAFEVGEVRGGEIELEWLVLAAAHDLPLVPLAVLINVQNFTKTANCWGVANNSKGTNTNRIVVLRRE
ncbi:MAG TPA: DNA methyltransferase [Roseiarcus sp.]|nr:DNA methyltransferase [Roseiarcus sp.]